MLCLLLYTPPYDKMQIVKTIKEDYMFMDKTKSIINILMCAVLMALLIIAIVCDLSFVIKVFTIFSVIYGFFELQKFFKTNNIK